MILYKLCPNDRVFGTSATCVQRLSDTAFIPFDPANTDYQEYLKWVSEGNTPYPADSAQPLPADEV